MSLPWPSEPTVYEVGAVTDDPPTATAGEQARYEYPEDAGDGSGLTLASRSITVRWYGGRWQSLDLRSFNIYANDGAGGSVSYATPIGSVFQKVAQIIAACQPLQDKITQVAAPVDPVP